MPRYLRAVVALWLLSIAAPARAADVTIAVLGLEAVDVGDDLAQQVTEALRQRVGALQGTRMLPSKDLVELKMVFNCDGESPTCLAQAGRSLGADKMLFGTLSTRAGMKAGIVALSLKLIDVKNSTLERSLSKAVARKELSQENLAQTTRKWLEELLLIEAHPTLHITSRPEGAGVFIAGRTLGRTPLTLQDLPAGAHEVTLSLDGYRMASRTITLHAGGMHDLAVTLDVDATSVAISDTPGIGKTPPLVDKARANDSQYRTGRNLTIAGGVLLGLGAVSAVTAIVLYTQYSSLQNDLIARFPAVNATPQGDPLRAQYISDTDRGNGLYTGNIATVATASVLGAVGLALLVVGQVKVHRSKR